MQAVPPVPQAGVPELVPRVQEVDRKIGVDTSSAQLVNYWYNSRTGSLADAREKMHPVQGP